MLIYGVGSGFILLQGKNARLGYNFDNLQPPVTDPTYFQRTLSTTTNWKPLPFAAPATGAITLTVPDSRHVQTLESPTLTIPTRVTDDFNRGDGALGGNWTTIGNPLNIDTNQVRATVTGGAQNAAAWTTNEMNTGNPYCQITVGALPAMDYSFVGCTINGTIDLSDGYVAYLQYNVGSSEWFVYLSRADDGVPTTIGSFSLTGASITPTAGDVLEIQRVGNDVRVYYNDVQRISETDTTYDTGVYAAIAIFIAAADNSARIDNFNAGAIASGAADITLTVAEGRQAQSAESPTLTQERTLIVADSSHRDTAESPILTKDIPALVVSDSRHQQTADSPSLTQETTLVVSDSRHVDTGDVPLLQQDVTLVVSDSRHVDTGDVPTLQTDLSLVVANSRHINTSDSPTLQQDLTLIVSDARHTDVCEEIVLTWIPDAGGAIVLTVADSRQPQFSDSITLTRDRTLVVADSQQPQSAESPTLTQESTLVVSDSRHPQTVESPILTQDMTLVVADARQPQAAESPTLTLEQTLVVAGSRHTDTHDAIVLTYVPESGGAIDLTIDGARHNLTHDVIYLPRERTLAVSDSRHTDTSDAISLEQVRTLVVSDTTHTNRPDSIALLQKIVLSVAESGHTVTNDIVGFAYEMMLGLMGDNISNIPDSITLSIDLWGALGLFNNISMQDITDHRTISGLKPLSMIDITPQREIEEYGKLSMVDITDERKIA